MRGRTVFGIVAILVGLLLLFVPRTAEQGLQTYHIWAWEEPAWGLTTSLPWIVIGILLVISDIANIALLSASTVTGLLLAALAMRTALSLLNDDSHAWYWRTTFPILYIVSLVFAFVGAFWVGQGFRPPERGLARLRIFGYILISLAVLSSLPQFWLIPVTVNYVLPVPPSPGDYTGDYLALRLHIVAFLVAVALWLVAGFVSGYASLRARQQPE